MYSKLRFSTNSCCCCCCMCILSTQQFTNIFGLLALSFLLFVYVRALNLFISQIFIYISTLKEASGSILISCLGFINFLIFRNTLRHSVEWMKVRRNFIFKMVLFTTIHFANGMLFITLSRRKPWVFWCNIHIYS